MTAATAIGETIEFLAASLETDNVPDWDVGVHDLLEMVIDLISEGDAEGLHAFYAAVERFRSTVHVPIAMADIAPQLQVLTTLLSLAAVRPGQKQTEELALREQKILRVLDDAGTPLDNSQLASRSGHDQAVVSRALRQLRAAGLVTAHRDWRRKLNQLTDKGREIVDAMAGPENVREHLSVFLAKLLEADARPADVWAIAHKAGVKIESVLVSKRNSGVTDVEVDIANWRISVPGESDQQARFQLAKGLARLAALAEFPISAPKGEHADLPLTPMAHALPLWQGSRQDAVFESICTSALLMPELPTTLLYLKCGDVLQVADAFKVTEDRAVERLQQLGLHQPTIVVSQDDPQPEPFPKSSLH